MCIHEKMDRGNPDREGRKIEGGTGKYVWVCKKHEKIEAWIKIKKNRESKKEKKI